LNAPVLQKDASIGGDRPDGLKRNPTTGPGILWRRSPTSRGRGNSKVIEQNGCRTALASELQTSIKLLLVELGMTFQSLQLSYADFGNMVTISWLKQVWEKLERFKFAVTVHNLHSMYPQEGDDWLMARLIIVRYRDHDLQTLNRVRKHQQVLFYPTFLGQAVSCLTKDTSRSNGKQIAGPQ
jgi:hypothetical protein